MALFACTAKAPEFTETDKAELMKLMEGNMEKLIASASELSTDALDEFLAPGPDKNFFMAGAAYTKDELISAVKADYKGFTSQKLSILDHNIKIIDANTVLWTALIAASSIYNEGTEESMNFTDTWYWEKSGDTWQVSHFHESWE